MPPVVLDQLYADILESPMNHRDDVPKGSEKVSCANFTYFLPTLSPSGLNATDLNRLKVYSISAEVKL